MSKISKMQWEWVEFMVVGLQRDTVIRQKRRIIAVREVVTDQNYTTIAP